MEELKPLVLEEQYRDRTFTTNLVNGLSPDEMDAILKGGDNVLQEILNKHNPGLGDMYRYGYGIYGIKHFGGHLLITVGNSCD